MQFINDNPSLYEVHATKGLLLANRSYTASGTNVTQLNNIIRNIMLQVNSIITLQQRNKTIIRTPVLSTDKSSQGILGHTYQSNLFHYF